MNSTEHGHHASGYREPEATEPSQGFMSRLVFWILVFAVCIGWVMTHTGCAHPIGNGLMIHAMNPVDGTKVTAVMPGMGYYRLLG